MNAYSRKRPYHHKNIQPADPAIKAWREWLPENQRFYDNFRKWLKKGGFSDSTLNTYGVAARQALGFLDKYYWQIDPESDLQRAWERLQTHPTSPATQDCYRKGLAKLAEYLRFVCRRPAAPKPIPWDRFLGAFPDWLAADVRDFIIHRARAWTAERKFERSGDLLSHLTLPLRWMLAHDELKEIGDLTPAVWYAYLDEQLAQALQPVTINSKLLELQAWLRFLEDQGRPVCARMLRVERLCEGQNLPKDVPLDQLRRLQAEILLEAAADARNKSRTGKLDLAWFLLMLHSGLRTCEVRDLRLDDLDFIARQARIQQSKGLKDRVVYLSEVTIQALQGYLDVRGPKEALPEQVFIYRHQPLGKFYCWQRLRTLGERCGVSATPHQLRHSCATLLLNAGAPVLTVQTILGHKWVDTTLGYARLYDGTVAADYYSAMAEVERRLALPEDRLTVKPGIGQLLALVDGLRQGTLNAKQVELVQQLRDGLIDLAEQEIHMEAVKVLSEIDPASA
jgi:site-specific recombinase XerD